MLETNVLDEISQKLYEIDHADTVFYGNASEEIMKMILDDLREWAVKADKDRGIYDWSFHSILNAYEKERM